MLDVCIYQATGDQPQAIEKLTKGVLSGMKEQSLLGVTGSGKTFTMANIIANVNRPTLVLAHSYWISTSFFISSSRSLVIPVRSEITMLWR